MHETIYRQSIREEELNPERADVHTNEHEYGFNLYRWPVKIVRGEYLSCRMRGKSTETVMSGGFSNFLITEAADVYAVQSFPIDQNGWIITQKITREET